MELGKSGRSGGYFYNASLKKKSNGLGSDIISITVGDSGTRKATLSSTAKGMISNTVSDYIMHHSLQDSIFDSLYSNDYSSERLHSIWAKQVRILLKQKIMV